MTATPPTPNWTPPQPAPASRGKKLALILGGIAAGFLALIVIAAVITLSVQGAKPTAQPTGQTAWDREQAQRQLGTTPTTPTTTEPAAAATPEAADFKLTPKITEKHCYGSAGCNVSFEVDLAYDGPTLDESDTWRLTYEVSGVDDGPLIGTLEVNGRRYDRASENAGTKSSKAKLTIKVTDVEKIGF